MPLCINRQKIHYHDPLWRYYWETWEINLMVMGVVDYESDDDAKTEDPFINDLKVKVPSSTRDAYGADVVLVLTYQSFGEGGFCTKDNYLGIHGGVDCRPTADFHEFGHCFGMGLGDDGEENHPHNGCYMSYQDLPIPDHYCDDCLDDFNRYEPF